MKIRLNFLQEMDDEDLDEFEDARPIKKGLGIFVRNAIKDKERLENLSRRIQYLYVHIRMRTELIEEDKEKALKLLSRLEQKIALNIFTENDAKQVELFEKELQNIKDHYLVYADRYRRKSKKIEDCLDTKIKVDFWNFDYNDMKYIDALQSECKTKRRTHRKEILVGFIGAFVNIAIIFSIVYAIMA